MQPDDQQPKEVPTSSEDTIIAQDTPAMSNEVASADNTTEQAPPAPVVSVSEPASVAQPADLSKKKISNKVKLLALILIVVIVLFGASAGAYFGVIVPSKPENVLKAAVANTLKEKQISYDGSVEVQAVDDKKSGAMKPTSLTFKGATDVDKNASKAEISATTVGIKIQGEVRYVDQTAFVKLGDLGPIKTMAATYLPDSASLIAKVENQWIEIDKTLLKAAKADCVLNTKLTASDDDIKLLSDAYGKNQFATIKSTTSDRVNGKSATKLELELDDNKMVDYAKNLSNLSFVKQIKGCGDSVSDSIDTSELKDNDITPLTVWIDKGSKRFVKFASHSTDQDAKKENIKGSGSVTLSYGPVSIDKPQNAKPLMTLIAEFAPLIENSKVRGANTQNPISLLGL